MKPSCVHFSLGLGAVLLVALLGCEVSESNFETILSKVSETKARTGSERDRAMSSFVQFALTRVEVDGLWGIDSECQAISSLELAKWAAERWQEQPVFASNSLGVSARGTRYNLYVHGELLDRWQMSPFWVVSSLLREAFIQWCDSQAPRSSKKIPDSIEQRIEGYLQQAGYVEFAIERGVEVGESSEGLLSMAAGDPLSWLQDRELVDYVFLSETEKKIVAEHTFKSSPLSLRELSDILSIVLQESVPDGGKDMSLNRKWAALFLLDKYGVEQVDSGLNSIVGPLRNSLNIPTFLGNDQWLDRDYDFSIADGFRKWLQSEMQFDLLAAQRMAFLVRSTKSKIREVIARGHDTGKDTLQNNEYWLYGYHETESAQWSILRERGIDLTGVVEGATRFYFRSPGSGFVKASPWNSLLLRVEIPLRVFFDQEFAFLHIESFSDKGDHRAEAVNVGTPSEVYFSMSHDRAEDLQRFLTDYVSLEVIEVDYGSRSGSPVSASLMNQRYQGRGTSGEPLNN